MRLERVVVVVVTVLTFAADIPKSRSGSESSSESELGTTSCPLKVVRLLAPEFADVWEGIEGGASALAALTVDGALDTEGFDEESGVETTCEVASWTRPDGRVGALFASAVLVSLR
jgi:hypothetical protein